ncbi:MAG: hypothetical protein ACE5FQ_11800 [Thiogranum sp.]
MIIQGEPGDKVRRLAWLPIIFIAEQEDVFERYGRDEDIEDAYRSVTTTSLWVYLLHTYHGLVRSHFGSDTEDRVREIQRDIFNSEESASGDAIITALELVECALGVDVEVNPDWNIHFKMPEELAVALALLLGLPDSPDYRSRKAKLSDYAVHRMPCVDWRLARVLGRGRRALVEAFEPLVGRLEHLPDRPLVQ